MIDVRSDEEVDQAFGRQLPRVVTGTHVRKAAKVLASAILAGTVSFVPVIGNGRDDLES
jgi:hypothetical protein